MGGPLDPRRDALVVSGPDARLTCEHCTSTFERRRLVVAGLRFSCPVCRKTVGRETWTSGCMLGPRVRVKG